MPTRETQYMILNKAVELFNARGTGHVSTNKIADSCKISRGNLHYHFKNKSEIIRAIFEMIVTEMDSGWYQDHLTPTVAHTISMFVRQLELIWRYRFFYRELVVLLNTDDRLRQRFRRDRARRIKFIKKFFMELENVELFKVPDDPAIFDALVLTTFLFSEYWLIFFETYGLGPGEAAIQTGYSIFLNIIRPYFSAKALGDFPDPSELRVSLTFLLQSDPPL